MIKGYSAKRVIDERFMYVCLYLFVSLSGQYFASIMIIVGMSVIATVVVLQYHHHDPNGGNMPKWVRLFTHKHIHNQCPDPQMQAATFLMSVALKAVIYLFSDNRDKANRRGLNE